jgi:hypothetical protein
MARIKRQELKVGDITDIVKETNGLVKENYLSGHELTISFWERDRTEKVLSSQLYRMKSSIRNYTCG